jgi:hypothetical protein
MMTHYESYYESFFFFLQHKDLPPSVPSNQAVRNLLELF